MNRKGLMVSKYSVITSMFRNTADRDYIAARICYRCGLLEGFYWHSLQALEKYLKAILLFNEITTRDVIHDIVKGLNKVKNIKKFQVIIPEDVNKFVKIINGYGINRYGIYSHYFMGDELYLLDKAVWFIRKYCQNFRHYQKAELKEYIKHLNQVTPENSKKISNQDWGYVEKILRKRNPDLVKEILVWNNVYFGNIGRKDYQRGLVGFNRSDYDMANYKIDDSMKAWLNNMIYFSKNEKSDLGL